MTDEQCQLLVDTLHKLIQAVEMGADKIMDSIDGIYMPGNEGIEKRIEGLAEVIDNASYIGTSCKYDPRD